MDNDKQKKKSINNKCIILTGGCQIYVDIYIILKNSWASSKERQLC